MWWHDGLLYQCYPRSFADSNGDGVGDLRGIAAHTDHFAGLGVEAIWLSPFYRSPMADFGYDVSDYCDVDPVFGTLADFDELVRECHAHAASVARLDQRVEVVERPEHRVDVAVVGDVVAEVGHRRAEERREPHRLDAEFDEVIDVLSEPTEVPDPVPVGVRERPRIDLVDRPPLPPRRLRHGR